MRRWQRPNREDDKLRIIVKHVQRIFQLQPFSGENHGVRNTCSILLNKLLRDHGFPISLLMNSYRFGCCSISELVKMVKQGQQHFQQLMEHTQGGC